MTTKEKLKIADILVLEFDYVPSELNEAKRVLKNLGEEFETKEIKEGIEEYGGYSSSDINDEIKTHYFEE